MAGRPIIRNGKGNGKKGAAQRTKGMAVGKSAAGAGQPVGPERRIPSPGDLTSLPASRLILDSAGIILLSDIVGELADLLDTSCAVCEKNGDYALRMFSSGWCRFMDQASRRRCDTPDNREARQSGKWLCSDSCGSDAALRAIETNAPADVACRGGMRIFAVPICAGQETVGSISIGYGDPPRDPAMLAELATVYGVGVNDLRRLAKARAARPPALIESAKKRIFSAARIIGEIVVRSQAEQTLRRREEKFRAMFDLAKDVIFIYDKEGRILEANREACERLGYSRDEFLRMKPFEIDTPEEAALFPERFATLRTQGHHLFETLHQKRDGTVIPVEVSVRLFESAGRLLSLSVCRDITERKRVEAALRESEEKYRSIVEQTTEWIWETDLNRVHTYSNHAIAAILGYSVEELVGQTPDSLLHPEDRSEVDENIPRLMAEKRGWHGWILRWRHRDGSYRFLESNANPILDSNGHLRGYRGVDRDITDRKRAEEALRASEALLRKSQAIGRTGSWELDLVADTLTWSDEAYRIFGLQPREFAASYDAFLAVVHPDDRERVDAAYSGSIREGRDTYEVEHRIVRRDSGEVRIVVEKCEHFNDTAGTVVRSVGMVQDITERKLVEEALRESEEKFRGIYEASPIGIELYDREGALVDANRACLDTFGISDVTAVRGFKLFEDPNLSEELKAQLRRGESVRYEVLFDFGRVRTLNLYETTKSGNVYLDLLMTPLKGASESVIGYLVHIRDITERKQIEVRMQEVQKLESLGVLAGGIAHDFNNLLMAILGNADLALLSLSPVSPACRYVEEIIRASQRAADLCQQMLAYSGKGRFVVDRHDISEIVREMGQILSVSISKKAILRYSLSEGLPAVESDATQMRQVIMNLITNASDAVGDAGGVITITTGVVECDAAYLAGSYLDDKLSGGTYVALEVSDTGCGMDAETKSRIFDPFFTTKFTGRGLGLAAVLGIVRGHKGAIRIYSEVGTGTTIKILLPSVEAEPDKTARTVEQIAPLRGGGTILLVDDDPVVRSVASQMLAKLGFRVLTANNGLEGLKVFRTQGAEIVCVVLDLMMPEMGGEETFRELRNLRSDVRVILSSGYNEQDATRRFVGRGLAGFIQKPYTTANLRNALQRVLG
ncbi:MAG: PAS domain S-box protein [Syntrophales bacterium]